MPSVDRVRTPIEMSVSSASRDSSTANAEWTDTSTLAFWWLAADNSPRWVAASIDAEAVLGVGAPVRSPLDPALSNPAKPTGLGASESTEVQ